MALSTPFPRRKAQTASAIYPLAIPPRSIIIPAGITAIGNETFFGSGLQSITLPDSITSIGDGAFRSCDLTSIIIPEGVISIGEWAFYECTELTEITLPASLTSFGKEPFHFCSALKTITVSAGSYAEQYCKQKGLNYTYPDANDWLLN